MVDEIFGNPRLASIYDPLDGDRKDLDLYVDFAHASGARTVLDVGCGTGSLAVRLAEAGFEVVGVDPAAASLDVARTKPNADRVRWVHGVAADVPNQTFDLVTMTANVAQAIHDPGDWSTTLSAIHSRLRPAGFLVFESRVPADKAWLRWNKDASYTSTEINGVGRVESWVELVAVDEPLVTFRWTYLFEDGDVLTSDSTLRFRQKNEVVESLIDAGFAVDDVRDAPDRTGAEYVFVARR